CLIIRVEASRNWRIRSIEIPFNEQRMDTASGADVEFQAFDQADLAELIHDRLVGRFLDVALVALRDRIAGYLIVSLHPLLLFRDQRRGIALYQTCRRTGRSRTDHGHCAVPSECASLYCLGPYNTLGPIFPSPRTAGTGGRP